MTGSIVSRETLSEHLLSRIQCDQIMAREQGGTFTLIPIDGRRTEFSSLLGLLSGSGVSTEEYGRQKQLDKKTHCDKNAHSIINTAE